LAPAEPMARSVSPLKLSPSVPQHPQSREATPRHDDNGNSARQESRSGASSEENNNSNLDTNSSATAGARSAMTPPPRPPPPQSAKLREAKPRLPDPPPNPEVNEGAVLRNKPVDAAAAQTQAQRKSVMDLTAMFEHTKPPAGRPVPPPRPNKSKVAPAN